MNEDPIVLDDRAPEGETRIPRSLLGTTFVIDIDQSGEIEMRLAQIPAELEHITFEDFRDLFAALAHIYDNAEGALVE